MDNFEGSTLWRISAFQHAREAEQAGLFAGDRPTLLPTTLLAELQQLESDPVNGDVLEVIAACLRHHEAALLYLGYEDYVWPITLFPREFLYHSPRDVSQMGTGTGRRAAGCETTRPCHARAGVEPDQISTDE